MTVRPLTLLLSFAALLSALVAACGGGSDESKPDRGRSYPALTVTIPYLSSPARAGVPVQFEGGECGGGNGQYHAAWNFGDNTGIGSSNVHTYQNPGTYQVVVKCTDTVGSPWAIVTADAQIQP